MAEAKSWFVTGCSSGLGRAIATEALAAGHNVVATVRDRDALAPLEARFGPALLPLVLDMTDGAGISGAVEQAVAAFGKIDVLVNNAGYCYLSAVENGRETEIRQLFEVNCLGPIALIQAVLPHMRSRRSGLVINISSGLGLVGLPGTGFYSATKFAIEGLTESLAHEVAPLGIKVILIEPGPIKTDFSGRSMRVQSDDGADYRGTMEFATTMMRCPQEEDLADPARCAQAIVSAAGSEASPFRLPLGAFVIEPAEDKWRKLTGEFAEHCDTARSVLLSQND